MDVSMMKEILKKQFGINSEAEFNKAIEKSSGINLGIFCMPLNERSINCEEQNNEASVA